MAAPTRRVPSYSVAIDDLLDGFLAAEVEESPTTATRLGIDGHDDRIGDFTEAAVPPPSGRRPPLARAVPAPSTTTGCRSTSAIDRDLVLSTLRGRQVMHEWAVWRRDPATYLGPCLSGRVQPLPQPGPPGAGAGRVRGGSAAGGAGGAGGGAGQPRPRAGGAACSSSGPRERAAPASPTPARSCRPRSSTSDDRKPARRSRRGGGVGVRVVPRVPGRPGGKAPGRLGLGETRYSALLTEKELLGYGAAAMRDARAGGVRRPVGGDVGAGVEDRSARRGRLAGARQAAQPGPPADARGDARRVRGRGPSGRGRSSTTTGIVSMPRDEVCRVLPSPPFQRPVLAVASYSAPPMFRPSATGTFFVPFPPDGSPDDDVQKRLETNSPPLDPGGLGARGVSRPPLAPRHRAAARAARSARCWARRTSPRDGASTPRS